MTTVKVLDAERPEGSDIFRLLSLSLGVEPRQLAEATPVHEPDADEMEKLIRLEQHTGHVYSPLRVDEAVELDAEQATQLVDLHHVFRNQAGMFSSLDINERIAALEVMLAIEGIASGETPEPRLPFSTLARATAVLHEMDPESHAIAQRSDLAEAAKELLYSLSDGSFDSDLELAERLVALNKHWSPSTALESLTESGEANLAAKLVEALVAKTEGRSISISRADYAAVREFTECTFAEDLRNGSGFAIRSYELLDWLRPQRVESYEPDDLLPKVRASLTLNEAHPLADMNFFFKLAKPLGEALEHFRPTDIERMRRCSARIKNNDDYDDCLIDFLGQIARHSEDPAVFYLPLRFQDLVEERASGQQMRIASADEYDELVEWVHTTFKEAYQEGVILAGHALKILDEVKVRSRTSHTRES